VVSPWHAAGTRRVRDRLPLQALLARPNRVVAAALLLLTALAWAQLLGAAHGVGAGQLHHAGSALLNPAPRAWHGADLATAFLMWALMAVAMMLPTAAPAILSFADITRRAERSSASVGGVSAFVCGYLCVWWGFGTLATGAQASLAYAAVRLPAFTAAGPAVGGVLLLVAGLYQFSALKDLCLTQCRSPLSFFLAHWHAGSWGAFRMGVRHGAHCVGCCWALMALMLCAGTMNVAWTAALTALMLAEKVIPGGRVIGRAVGVALIGWGGALLVPA
jgi:predicted metal-binding membrane protein